MPWSRDDHVSPASTVAAAFCQCRNIRSICNIYNICNISVISVISTISVISAISIISIISAISTKVCLVGVEKLRIGHFYPYRLRYLCIFYWIKDILCSLIRIIQNHPDPAAWSIPSRLASFCLTVFNGSEVENEADTCHRSSQHYYIKSTRETQLSMTFISTSRIPLATVSSPM